MDNHKDNLPGRILIVDDQETTRFFVSETLQQAGFSVETVGSGAEAMKVIANSPPALVVLDVVMPGMDGFEVCAEIRSRLSTRRLPVLMMTGLDDEDSITHAYDVGATDFINKPFKRVVLSHRVRYMLRAQQIEDKIHQLAYFDVLTGLSNRESFKDRLINSVAVAKRHSRTLSILFVDLDDFKRINDTLGHSVGDMLLKEVAVRLLDSVRETDAVVRNVDSDNGLVARLGGDEFIILLPEIGHADHAATVARRILHSLSQTFSLAGNEVFITPSIGISVFPQDSEAPEALLQHADAAMYCAKRAGKNLYKYYDESMNSEALRRHAIDPQLRTALERNEFELHYQPQMDVASGQICGVEALLRWNNQEMGAVSPAEFIPLAEENGLIIKIGEWVLATACAQAKAWQDEGLPLGRIGVNISVLQFAQSEFVGLVAQILSETGLDAHALELEITESMVMNDVEGAIRTMEALKALGVQLAIDDFGTGYSSLSYLKRLPIDRLKIDHAFIRDVTADPDDSAIVTAVITMATRMNLETVAEGVETGAQLQFLHDNGCQIIQGYYFSRPLPSEVLRDLLRQGPNVELPVCRHGTGVRTVLFIDDDETLLDVFKLGLQSEGYRVLCATNPAAAFDNLARYDVEVVVADYQMPEMNGIEILKRVKSLCPYAVRVMLSGRSDMRSVVAAINDGGIFKFLEKPVPISGLKDTLRKAFLLHDQVRSAIVSYETTAPVLVSSVN